MGGQHLASSTARYMLVSWCGDEQSMGAPWSERSRKGRAAGRTAWRWAPDCSRHRAWPCHTASAARPAPCQDNLPAPQQTRPLTSPSHPSPLQPPPVCDMQNCFHTWVPFWRVHVSQPIDSREQAGVLQSCMLSSTNAKSCGDICGCVLGMSPDRQCRTTGRC